MNPKIEISELWTLGSVQKSRVLVDSDWAMTILAWEDRFHIIRNRDASPQGTAMLERVKQRSHPTFGAAEQAIRDAVAAHHQEAA